MIKAPFSSKIMGTVLAFVVAIGGSYGGYKVLEDTGTGLDFTFDKRTHTVSAVVDGDTIMVDEKVTVRLTGIDAPEVGQCYGAEAKAYLTKTLLGREVVLEKDQDAIDKYGRLLRYVLLRVDDPIVGDKFINEALLRDGYALHIKLGENKRYRIELGTAQGKAKVDNLGLWGECDMDKDKEAPMQKSEESFNDECVIKGNVSQKSEKSYFTPECGSYKRTKIDTRRGESWFCTEKEAQKAGFTKSASCDNTF